ncbi:MAG TPA: membrane protein insertase YidC [bacterium]|nr:membrane protein insertase YidC [bacterium]
MSEEQRLLLAFILSLVIIFVFSRLYQPVPGRPGPVTTPAEKIGSSSETQVSLAGKKSRQVVNLETELVRLTVGSNGGSLEEIALKNYRRPGEQFFTIASGSRALLSYPEEEVLSWGATEFKVEREEKGLTLTGFPRPGIEENKRYYLSSNGYTITYRVNLKNHTGEEVRLKNYCILGGIFDLKDQVRERSSAPEFKAGTPVGIIRRQVSPRLGKETGEECFWVAFWSHYAMFFLRPEKGAGWFLTRQGQEVGFGVSYPEVVIPARGEKRLSLSFYAGPSDYFVLSREVKEPVLGNGFFASMGRFLFAVLRAIHQVVPNWGWAIILLTLLVKAVFFPLTRSSLQSMKEMQRLRPYLKDLQTKYRDNPQQMQKEMMNLYREYKINPFSGCLPMLIQFPIFIGFFVALRNSVFLRGAPFILWIRDLSQPDCLFTVAGFPINLLPVIMAGTSFWQQKLTPQEPSQKSLTFLMPVMFLFLFYNFSSGLLLYWVTMNLAGLLEQYLITRAAKPALL